MKNTEKGARIVSFIIPALNEEKHLNGCLASIRAQASPALPVRTEVIVVDNRSTDRTASLAREQGCRIIQVEPGNVSRARNRGAEAAMGEFLAFVDADCEIHPDWLSRMLHLVEDRGAVAAGSEVAYPGKLDSWVERGWHRLAYESQTADASAVPWLASFNLFMRRDSFLGEGGFNEYLLTCEDVDLCHRLGRRGLLLRDVTVRTRHHCESKSLSELFRREAWRGHGSLRSLVNSRFHWREIRSILVPALFLLLGAAGMALLAWGIISGDRAPGWVGLASISLAGLLPAFTAMLRRVFPWEIGEFGRSYALLATYLAARATGLICPVGRVLRR